jgi:metallo-beta-lactamase class B
VVVNADLTVEEIAPGVWRHVSWAEIEGFGRSAANGVVVVGDGAAAMVDTPWNDEFTSVLFDWVVTNLGCPITTVVATHYHRDNLGGLEEAHARGAVSWSLERTLTLAESYGNPVPGNGFTDRKRLSVGGRTLELRYLGGGHTVDTIVVWVEDEKVLFGGCLVRSAGAAAPPEPGMVSQNPH